MTYEYIWYTDKLKGEYKEAFDKVEIYASVRNIDADTQNDMPFHVGRRDFSFT